MHPHKDTHTHVYMYIYMQCFMHTCNYACYNHYIDIFNNAPCTNTFVKVLWPHFVQPLTRLQHFFGRTSTISKQHLWHMQYSFLEIWPSLTFQCVQYVLRESAPSLCTFWQWISASNLEPIYKIMYYSLLKRWQETWVKHCIEEMYVYNYIYRSLKEVKVSWRSNCRFKNKQRSGMYGKMQLVGKKCLERRVPVPVVEIRTLHTDLDRKIALLQKGMLHH